VGQPPASKEQIPSTRNQSRKRQDDRSCSVTLERQSAYGYESDKEASRRHPKGKFLAVNISSNSCC
jgi:hypothetical protein